MSVVRKIAHNTFYQAAGKVTSTILGLITIALMTRYLGKEGFGYYATIIAFLQFFSIFADMGLYLIVVKYISEPNADEQKILSNIFTLRLLTAIIFLGLSPIAVLFFPYPNIVKWGVALTSLSFLFITLNQVLIGVFQKHFTTYKTALAENAGRIMLLLATIAVIYNKGSLIMIMSAVVLGSFTNFLVTFFLTQKYARIRFAYDATLWKQVFKDTWPVALSIIFNLVYFKADTVILSLVQPVEHVGIYGATYKVLEVLTTFPAMFAGLMTPLLTQTYTSGRTEQFRTFLQHAFNFMIMVSIPMIIITLILGTDIMVLISGSEFAPAGNVLRIIIFATAAIFIGNLFGNTIVVIHKQRTMMKVYALVAIGALAGYFFFIPTYSYFGAAVMSVFAEAVIMTTAMIIVLKTTRISLSFRAIGKSLAAALLTAIVVGFLKWQHIHLIITLLVSLPIYALILYIFKGFTKEMLRDILKI